MKLLYCAPDTLEEIGKDVRTVVENTADYRIFDLIPSEGPTFWIAFVGLCFSILATWFGYRGYHYQKLTSDNTGHVSIEIQKSEFRDIIRHLYRNLICTLAFTKQWNVSKCHGEYPSEEHLKKLKLLEDDVHLEKFHDNLVVYDKMHNFKLLVRNYHIEIDLTLQHMMNGSIANETVDKDIQGLQFKPFHLIKQLTNVEAVMNEYDPIYKYEGSEQLKKKAFSAIFISHILNVKSNANDKLYRNYPDGVPLDRQVICGYDCNRSYQDSFPVCLDKEFIMNYAYEFCSEDNYKDVVDFLSGKGCFDKLRMPDNDKNNYKSLLLGKSYDVTEILTYAMSIDVAIEYGKINIVKFKQ